jgi:peptidyl-tRNA hydrolase, PTH1 family
MSRPTVDWVIIGLRNPGADYAGTRHNLGAEVVAALAGRHGFSLARGPLRVRAEMGQGTIGEVPAALVLPLPFMNDSGPVVAAALRWYHLGPERLLVVHDDIDLPFGKLRIAAGRGSGGHNGVRSVMRSLGDAEFTRLKLGVGRPPGRMDPAAFVLRRFDPAELPEVDLLVDDAADVVETALIDPAAAVRMAGSRQPRP